MRRILAAATILAAACGGKSTIQATPEIKATATQASQGMSSTSTSTQASIGLQVLGSSVADTLTTGSVATLDLSVGLSDPNSLAAGATAPPEGSPSAVVVPKITTTTVSRGDSLWRLSQLTYGAGTRYAVIYKANREQIRNPNRIYPGQILVLPSR